MVALVPCTGAFIAIEVALLAAFGGLVISVASVDFAISDALVFIVDVVVALRAFIQVVVLGETDRASCGTLVVAQVVAFRADRAGSLA